MDMLLALKMMQSLDGTIAQNYDDNLSWGSSADKKLYKKFTTEFGTVIVGSTTFEQTPKIAFKNRFCVVLTRDKSKYQEFLDSPDFLFLEPNPQSVVEVLEARGLDKAVVIGGSKINSMFLQAGLINNIYITIAPKIFGSGIKIFGDVGLNLNLELVEFERLDVNELLLTYKVLNNLE
jgi:dihydrofolate reductase